MTFSLLVQAVVLFGVMAAQHIWLRHRLRRRLYTALTGFLTRHGRHVRRTLAAAARAATFHLYRPRHPRRIP
ncbi:MAG TPA: hypothetical protein VMZ00_09055 [Sporichthya sp.]|nr:hypothetical protein [Sporichthya sp.]